MSKARNLADVISGAYDLPAESLDNAVQPGDNISDLTNDSGFATETYVDTEIGNIDIPDPITKSASDPSTTTNGTLGDVFVNTTSGEMFVLTDATTDANVWTNIGDGTGSIGNYDVEYLVIAGGGGGGTYGGGGGAGGYRTGTLTLTDGSTYSATVGAGGASVSTSGSKGGDGEDSVFSTITSIGGGGGSAGGQSNAGSGGSGGGGSYQGGYGTGTTGQGNNGSPGAADLYGELIYLAGGGGGAGSAGTDYVADPPESGSGGAGLNTQSAWATATSTGDGGYYAGGGGGGTPVESPYYPGQTAGSGGAGGGGAGGTGGAGTNGTPNTGGGGGGAGYRQSVGHYSSGSGGSGIVIIRYAGSQKGTGGTVVESGGYTYHTFTSSGTYTA
jgi:hypothetical protein